MYPLAIRWFGIAGSRYCSVYRGTLSYLEAAAVTCRPTNRRILKPNVELIRAKRAKNGPCGVLENNANSQALCCCLKHQGLRGESFSIQRVSEWIHGSSSKPLVSDIYADPLRLFIRILKTMPCSRLDSNAGESANKCLVGLGNDGSAE